MATAASEASRPAVRAHDPGAIIAGLFDGHARTVYALCAVLLRDAHEAEDATQQAFLSAFEAIGAGTLPERPEAWLYSIARNECLDRLRRRARRPESPLDREPVAPGADVVAERNAALAAACAVLRELPERQRDALVLHEVCGLDYAHVAAALGVSTSAVESLIFRARRQLGERTGTVRALAATLVLPVGLRESVAGAAPGLGVGASAAGVGAGGGSAMSAGGVAVSLTAKVLALPIAGKLAVAVAVVAGAGSVGYGVEQAAGHRAAPREAPAQIVGEAAPPPPSATAAPGSESLEAADAPTTDEARAEPPPAAAQPPAEEPTSGPPAASRPPGDASGLPAPAPPAEDGAAPPPDELQHTDDPSEPPAAVEEPPVGESESPAELPSDQPGEPPPSGGDGEDDRGGGADTVEPPAGGEGEPVDENDGGEGEDANDGGDEEPGGSGDGTGGGDNPGPSPAGSPGEGPGEAGEPPAGPPEARCRAWRRMDAALHALLDADRLERWHALGTRLGCSH